MNVTRVGMSILVLTTVASIGAPCVGFAQPTAARRTLRLLVSETQSQSQDEKVMEMVWWIPPDFWKVAFAERSDLGADQVDRIVDVLSPYTMVVAAHGDVGPFGGVAWESDEALRAEIAIVDLRGHEYTPLAPDHVGRDATNLAAVLQPLFVSLLGPLGESFHVYYFPARTDAGAPIVDPRASGSFTIKIGAHLHHWRLPLSALLPEKICPVDGERLSGAWKFCPWHGKELAASQ